jgi:predicted transcriptional regulator
MKRLAEREAEILERTLYMLSENSVSFVSEQDQDFRKFIEKLADTVWEERPRLIN